MKHSHLLSLFVLLTFWAACQSTNVAPFGAGAKTVALETDEQKIWKDAERFERRIEESGLVYSNAELEAYIHSVAVRLVANQLENPNTQLQVRVLRLSYRNAWTFPNGVFYITTGMLACLDSEAELAAVLGHETTHFIRRHSLKETRSAANKKVWVNVLGDTSTVVGLGPVFGEIGSVWATSAILGYSRELENEADEQGLRELVEAGYDPTAMLHLFDYLREEDEWEGKMTKNRPATHPEIQDRVAHCRELLATRYADATGPGRRINRDEYLAHVQQVLLDNAAIDEAAGRLDFARRAVDKYITQWPDRAPGYFVRGEICRRGHGPEVAMQVETAYQEAARLDSCFAEPHRELGLLYRSEGRLQEARDEFVAYLTLAPKAIDTPSMRRYVVELSAEVGAPTSP
jgi:beta-barrel assembly-enhancing protease